MGRRGISTSPRLLSNDSVVNDPADLKPEYDAVIIGAGRHGNSVRIVYTCKDAMVFSCCIEILFEDISFIQFYTIIVNSIHNR